MPASRIPGVRHGPLPCFPRLLQARPQPRLDFNTSPVKPLTNWEATSSLSAGHDCPALPEINTNLPVITDCLPQFPSQNRSSNSTLVLHDLTLLHICPK